MNTTLFKASVITPIPLYLIFLVLLLEAHNKKKTYDLDIWLIRNNTPYN